MRATLASQRPGDDKGGSSDDRGNDLPRTLLLVTAGLDPAVHTLSSRMFDAAEWIAGSRRFAAARQ